VPYRNNLGVGEISIREQLSIDNNIISTKVTTGNAPNNLEIISNIVEDAYAISEEIVRSRESLIKLMSSQITIMVVDTISAVKSRRLLKVLLDSGSTMTVITKKLRKHTSIELS